MVSLPRDITPGAAARRSLLADFLIALVLALVAILLAAGIGVVGFAALLVLLVLLLSIAIEWLVRRGFRRRRVVRPAAAERPAVPRLSPRVAPQRDLEKARGAGEISERSEPPASDPG